MKDYQKQFVIHFSGLSDEIHEYEFQIVKEFFNDFGETEILGSNVYLKLLLDKKPRILVFNFEFKGYLNLCCDRCLDSFDFPIKGKEMLIIKFGDEEYEETDEIVIVPESAYEIDIRQYIYEFIKLMLPIKKVHPDDENGNSLCNEEVVKLIYRGGKRQEVDPRWNALQELKKEDNK
ncbi:MAG: DUF177 domain-containing protein [Saprospiraceae bacterium]|nr:DUF177 domain-containing protein [Saprospiraceae bacterium]